MKRLLFFICICFACVLTVQAQENRTFFLQLNDTVTIRYNNTYLSVDDNGTTIIAHGEPNDNALWKIVWCKYTGSGKSALSQYQFQHVNTGDYLHVNEETSGSWWRPTVSLNLALADNPSLFNGDVPNNQNAPVGTAGQYEAARMYYNTTNNNTQKYYLTVASNAWKLQQSVNQTIYIEKWEKKRGNIGFGAYFSPEAYDFSLVKDTYTDENDIEKTVSDESIVQTKKIRFVVDLRDSTYVACVRTGGSDKKLLLEVTEERDLSDLINTYDINPTFKWNSNSGNENTSTLTLSPSGYTSAEEKNRPMMSFEVGEIKDNLAWEITLNALGKSPMGLKRRHNDAVETWDNYVDYLEATWTYNNTSYTHQMRIIRKSYHTEELPEFEFTVSPSTYTFDGNAGERIIQIDGYHQHGLSYYDVDNQVIERVYTYRPTQIPLQNFDVDKDGHNDLTVKFTCTTLDDTTTLVDWLSVKQGSITDNSVTVVAQPNNDVYRRARLYGTFALTKGSDGQAHEHSGVIMPIINQRKQGVGTMKFKHYQGIAEDATLDPITHRQQVHTTERTIYYTPDQDIQLRLAEANFFGYMRWYDYDSATGDGGDPYWNSDEQKRTSWVTSPRGGNGTAFRAINTEYGQSRGLYGTNNKNGDNSGGDPKGGPLTRDSENTNAIPVLKGWNYTREGTIDPNAYHTIACDVSAYTDYQVWYTGDRRDSIQEPTLSYRQLFHMKPAEEMARELCKKSHLNPGQFLENYTYLAERGTDMHLATNYRYAKYSHESELCYFFFDKKENLMRVGKDAQAQWYRINLDANGNAVDTTTIINPNYTVKDFLRVDADYDGKVIYELRVPKEKTSKTGNLLDHDILIARFEITIVQDGACGPVGGNGLMSIHEMNEHYQLLEHIDFSFGAPAPGTTNLKQLNKHLPWEQSTYGYYYPKEGGDYADQTAVDYNILGKTSSNRADQHIPYYGEYFLINKIDKDWAKAEQHGGAANGYALYVDGTTEPGRVMSISTDAVICAGQTLYCSAWVCNPNPSTNDGRVAPIFRFNVEGREKKADNTWGEWEDVSVYFAGTLPAKSGWQQIVFPVLSDKSYDETRVSLYNFATGGNGNDFMVDDISLFVSRLPLASYQAQTNCSSDANTESSTAVVLRIDYTDFQGERDQYMYYQIFKEKNEYDPDDTAHPIELQYTTNDNSAYFHDNQANSDAKTYGSVLIPDQEFNPVEYNRTAKEANKDTVLIFKTVQGFKDYLVDQVQQNLETDPNGEKSTHAKAYIKTTDSRGQSKWLIYVMHIVPNAKEGEEAENGQPIEVIEKKYLRECYNYSLRMANVPEELAAPECNLQTPLHSTQATHFDLHNGDKKEVDRGFIPRSLNNCANDYYTLTSVIENVMAITTGSELDKVRGEVLSDWLVGFNFDEVYANTKHHEEQYKEAVRAADDAFKDKYGYTRAQVKTAILYDLRRQDTLNTNLTVDRFEALDPHAFADPFNYTVIKHLHDNGWLQLRKSSTSFYLASKDTVRYWVYPIDGTATATYNNLTVQLQDCTEPIWVHVTSAESNHVLNIAPVKNAEKTDAQKRQIPTVRVLHSTLADNTKTITIPITDINTTTTQNPVPVGDTTKIAFSLSNLSNLNDYIHFVDSTTGQKIDVPTTFEIGKTYMMRMRFTDNGGNTHTGTNNTGCRVGTVYFRLLVLPNRVIWAPPTGIYDGWGLDGNWKGWHDADNDGQIDARELTEGFVPMAGSDVIIGNVPTNGVTLPTIDEYEHYPYVHDHNHYPMDVNASPFTCGKIYFAPGAHIHNQHLLHYDQAFVDMVIPSATWNTVSAPLQDMYSGDMFVPHNGMWDTGTKIEESDPFVVSNFQGTRHRDAAYAFSQAFYNQTVEKHYENKGGVNVSASAAFVTSNALSQKLETAKGFSMRGYGPGNPQREHELTIRLPKPDTEYYYYDTQGNETTQKTDPLSRTNAGRLAFTPTGEGENLAMSITLTNEVSGANQSFLFGNPTMALIDMKKLHEDNGTTWTGAYSYITDNQWGASTQALDDNGRFLPPMTSVMLHTNSNSQSLTINLKPSHLTISPRDVMSLEKGEPQPVAPRQSSVSDVPYSRPMTMSLYAYTDRASARAILAASPTASDRYQIGEDALFISSGVEMSNVVVTPLNMYTLSEQVPMMVDVRENIDSIPVALLAKDNYRSDSITFAFHLSANWDKECYFYDAFTDTRYRIMDGMIVILPAPQNHENRYYIVGPDRTSNGENIETAIPSVQDQENMVWAYSEQAGEMTVCSNDIIQSVTIYDITGRLIAHKALDLLYNQVSLPVGQGVHIAEVTLRDNSKHYTRTIVK